MNERFIYWFGQLRSEHTDLVGKKSANLSEMSWLGLPVPAGFAISLSAYETFMDRTNAVQEVREYVSKLGGALKNVQALEEASKNLRNIIESKSMPNDMEENIVAAYDELCHRCGTSDVAVSVRSAGAVSRPGQYETYLNVKVKADLIEKIKRVWSSTFGACALAFRQQKDLPLEKDPLGVAVVRMVNAYAAGICFTANPNTGDTSKIIIEGNWGLGESVVSGSVIPDRYVLDKQTLQIQERELGEKARYIVCGDVGSVERDCPPEKVSCFCLSDEEAKEIGRLGKVLETHFNGVPQDLEWALDSDMLSPKNVVLLQTRPVVIAKKRDEIDIILDLIVNRFHH
jgi:pyruvate,water dikinase